MRLLERDSAGKIGLKVFPHGKVPDYAILSHTWSADEVTFEDMTHGTEENKLGYQKIRFCGDQASRDDLQDIWFELLQHHDPEDPDWIRELTADELNFNRAIRVLSDHGLIEVDMTSQEQIEPRGYSMHTCVHAWTIHVLNQEWNHDLARLAMRFVASHVPDNDTAKRWLTQRRLIRHVTRCLSLMSNDITAYDGMEWVFHNLGNLYSDRGRLDEAEKMYQRALDGREKALGPDHTSTLDTVHNLGLLYSDRGRLDEAEKMYRRALDGREKALGPDHTSTLDTVHNLGNLYSDRGRLDEAEKMYRRALDGYEKALGPDHTSTLLTVNNLGILYRSQGKLDEAEKMYRRALDGYEKALGLETVSRYRPALKTAWNLGDLFATQGKISEARVMYSRASSGFKALLGPSSSEHKRLNDIIILLDSPKGP